MNIQIDISDRKNHQHLSDATLIDGVVRWVSNGSVPPDEILEKVFRMHPEMNYKKCKEARDADLKGFLANYRKNYKGPSDETRAEARAAFGPNHEITNIITGHKWRT